MAAWPASLPDSFLIKGFQYQPGDPTVTTDMEAGQDKKRRRYSTTVDVVNGNIFIEGTQYNDLIDFYENTTQHGALKFDWNHPITQNQKEFRFVGPPSITPLSGDQYRAQIELEILV